MIRKMKALLVIVANDIQSIDSITPWHFRNIFYLKDEVIMYRKFQTLEHARVYFAEDLLDFNKIDYSLFDIEKIIFEEKRTEIIINGVNISIRVGDEMESLLIYLEKHSVNNKIEKEI